MLDGVFCVLKGIVGVSSESRVQPRIQFQFQAACLYLADILVLEQSVCKIEPRVY